MNKILAKEIEAKDNEAKLEAFKTELKKNQFIEEIRSGLGEEIKRNPRTVKKIKIPLMKRILTFCGKIFTKF